MELDKDRPHGGRTYERKRSDQITAQHLASRGPSTYGNCPSKHIPRGHQSDPCRTGAIIAGTIGRVVAPGLAAEVRGRPRAFGYRVSSDRALRYSAAVKTVSVRVSRKQIYFEYYWHFTFPSFHPGCSVIQATARGWAATQHSFWFDIRSCPALIFWQVCCVSPIHIVKMTKTEIIFAPFMFVRSV
jgi:hypothetical protein